MSSSKLLCFPDLRSRGVLLGRRQIDRLEAVGKFPRRVHVSDRRVGWVAEEIDAHVAAKIANRCGVLTKVNISTEAEEEWRRARENASQAMPERAAAQGLPRPDLRCYRRSRRRPTQRALDKVQGIVDSATSALSGIDDALGLLAQQKAEADSQLVEERDRAERAKVSEEINAAVSDIEKRVEPTLSAMREIAEKLIALDHLSFEVGQLGRHLSGVAGEAEIAFAFVVPDARRMADAVKDGSAAIPRRPKAAPVPVPDPVAPTMTVFMLRSANYRDETGRKRFAGQYEDAMMPVPTAQRALRLGAAVPVTDPRRAQLRGARGSDYRPLAPDVVDLDAIEEPKGVPYLGVHIADPALREANFTVIDRGPDRALKVTP